MIVPKECKINALSNVILAVCYFLILEFMKQELVKMVEMKTQAGIQSQPPSSHTGAQPQARWHDTNKLSVTSDCSKVRQYASMQTRFRGCFSKKSPP